MPSKPSCTCSFPASPVQSPHASTHVKTHACAYIHICIERARARTSIERARAEMHRERARGNMYRERARGNEERTRHRHTRLAIQTFHLAVCRRRRRPSSQWHRPPRGAPSSCSETISQHARRHQAVSHRARAQAGGTGSTLRARVGSTPWRRPRTTCTLSALADTQPPPTACRPAPGPLPRAPPADTRAQALYQRGEPGPGVLHDLKCYPPGVCARTSKRARARARARATCG